MDAAAKRELYTEVRRRLDSVLDGIGDPVAAMATTACILHTSLPHASWTGFYRVVAPGLLRIGPYQGPLGCLEIGFDRGVCGAAARTGDTQVVDDVDAFPGHIACDPAARSEIVVPILAPSGTLAAVLDVDSHEQGAFDDVDRESLEGVAATLRPHFHE